MKHHPTKSKHKIAGSSVALTNKQIELEVVKRLAAPNRKKTSEPNIKYATVTEWEKWKKKKITNSIILSSRGETANSKFVIALNQIDSIKPKAFWDAHICSYGIKWDEPKKIQRLTEIYSYLLILLNRGKCYEVSFPKTQWNDTSRFLYQDCIDHHSCHQYCALNLLAMLLTFYNKQKPLLSAEYGKLNVMRWHLTKAESAARKGNWELVYSSQHKLAVHFLSIEDIWLSDYFFKSAMTTSLKIRVDGRRREADALYYMALARERHGDISSASKHMDDCYDLSVGRAWTNDDGELLELACCNRMSGLFTFLAEQCSDLHHALPLFKRALEAAREGESQLEVARAALKLGSCYHGLLDNGMASQYLKEALEAADKLNNDALFGDACKAMALSHLQQGSLDRCLNILEPYVKKFENSANRKEFAKAATCLGTVLNITGTYQPAVASLASAYDESEFLGREEVKAVRLGVAKGNLMLNSFMSNLERRPSAMMPQIGAWKDQGVSRFDNPRSQGCDLSKVQMMEKDPFNPDSSSLSPHSKETIVESQS